MEIKRYIRNVAPHADLYDALFALFLGVIVLAGFATFVETTEAGLLKAWLDFIKSSGLIALLTAWTAIIALYRLRHRPDKTRPAVREDFDDSSGGDETDFGLRNFGPGPALYVQAVVTIERDGDGELEEVGRLKPHDRPFHLREGEFAGLIFGDQKQWLEEMAEKYEIEPEEGVNDQDQENPPMINLYYSYVSHSGAREPTSISAERDDTNILKRIKDPKSEARSVELSRVVGDLLN